MKRNAPVVVAARPAFDEMMAQLLAAPVVAVDSESDSLYSYVEKVCLIQFSVPGVDYVLDTLAVRDLEPLGKLFASPTIEKVFHAAEYDIMVMKRDFKFGFVNIYDTMVAARILGWKQVGLGSILEQRFGIKLDKRYQRADWGKRPLTPEEIAYARDDTHYLIALRELQKGELDKIGRAAEAQEEFDRLTRVAWGEREFDPNRYYTIEGARHLDPIALGVLRELYRLREEQARKEDRPPFKIMSESTLLQIAQVQPQTPGELGRVPGVGDWLIRRHGRAVLDAIERGIQNPQRIMPRLLNRNAGKMPDPATRERYARLKEWRRTRAEARGVESDVIVPNEALIALARRNPQTRAELEQIPALGAWKIQEYGDELLRLLQADR